MVLDCIVGRVVPSIRKSTRHIKLRLVVQHEQILKSTHKKLTRHPSSIQIINLGVEITPF